MYIFHVYHKIIKLYYFFFSNLFLQKTGAQRIGVHTGPLKQNEVYSGGMYKPLYSPMYSGVEIGRGCYYGFVFVS